MAHHNGDSGSAGEGIFGSSAAALVYRLDTLAVVDEGNSGKKASAVACTSAEKNASVESTVAVDHEPPPHIAEVYSHFVSARLGTPHLDTACSRHGLGMLMFCASSSSAWHSEYQTWRRHRRQSQNICVSLSWMECSGHSECVRG